MKNKKCFKCGDVKPLNQFYKHPQMGDKHLNKCIECAKEDVKKRASKLSKDPEWVEKERARSRDKHFRLYRGRKSDPDVTRKCRESYKKRCPEKIKASSSAQHIKAPPGKEKHHWSYNEEHYKDVIFLTTMEHNKLHRYIKYNQPKKMYETLEGLLLDTKEKHINYYNLIKKLP